MEQTDAEVARVLSVLQGRFAGHSIHQPSLPSSPSIGGAEGSMGSNQLPKVWAIPAGVGSDLTRPATLSALVAQWATLEESQKINAILGIAHVGQNKMQPVRSSVVKLAELAKNDSSSDWVRVLGCTLGEVGVTGKMTPLENLESGSAVRAEIEAGVKQLYAAALAKLSELKLTAGMLPYVSPKVADATASSAIRDIYGDRPSESILAQILARAKDEEARAIDEETNARGNANARRASVAAPRPTSPRPTDIDAPGPTSAPLSLRGSPEPNDVAATGFSDLFGDSDGDDMEGVEPASHMILHVKSSHRADHVGRMKRLLAAAEPASVAAGPARGAVAIDTRRPSAGMPRSPISPVTPGANPADFSGRRLGVPQHGGLAVKVSKIGMLAPRRRAAPTNAALPGAGLGTAAALRRGSEASGGNGAQHEQPKTIQKVNVEDAGDAMQARDRLMQERKEKAAEEREAKRLKRVADAEERKRKREETAEKKKTAAAEGRPSTAKRGRPRGATSRAKAHEVSDESSGNESEGDVDGSTTAADDDSMQSPTNRSTRSGSEAPRQNVYIPPQEYRTFAGNDPQIRAVYANTNALTDKDRLHMYCFFNAYPAPPDAPQKLDILLNEQILDDPDHPGRTYKEIMVLEADFSIGTWSKKRRTRRS